MNVEVNSSEFAGKRVLVTGGTKARAALRLSACSPAALEEAKLL